MTAPNPAVALRAREQAEMLARAFAADIRRQQSATAALVAELAGVRQPALAGGHDRLTLAQLVADSGFSDLGRETAAPVLSINGRAYR